MQLRSCRNKIIILNFLGVELRYIARHLWQKHCGVMAGTLIITIINAGMVLHDNKSVDNFTTSFKHLFAKFVTFL